MVRRARKLTTMAAKQDHEAGEFEGTVLTSLRALETSLDDTKDGLEALSAELRTMVKACAEHRILEADIYAQVRQNTDYIMTSKSWWARAKQLAAMAAVMYGASIAANHSNPSGKAASTVLDKVSEAIGQP